MIGIPFAIVYLIRKAITLQSIVIEERGGTSGLKRSGELVRGRELRVFAIAALVNGTVALLGPIIGVAMMFVTPCVPGLHQSRRRARVRVRAARGRHHHRAALLRPTHPQGGRADKPGDRARRARAPLGESWRGGDEPRAPGCVSAAIAVGA